MRIGYQLAAEGLAPGGLTRRVAVAGPAGFDRPRELTARQRALTPAAA